MAAGSPGFHSDLEILYNALKGNIEILRSLRANGFKPSLYFIIQKILGKLKQLNTSRLKNER